MEQAIRDEIRTATGRLSCAQLRERFDGVPRSRLRALLKEESAQIRRRRREQRSRCHWSVPGAVWAMDHTEVCGDAGLVVMDLASRRVLHAAVAPGYGGEHVSHVLRGLIDEHGAPLVIKSDNGSPLIGEEVRVVLRQNQIESLRSPVRRPTYNGACEAMVGEVKRAALDLALQHGGAWSAWLTPAGELLNGYEREDIGVPESIWNARLRNLGPLRAALGELLGKIRGLALTAPRAHASDTKAERSSLRQALCELQILKIERP